MPAPKIPEGAKADEGLNITQRSIFVDQPMRQWDLEQRRFQIAQRWLKGEPLQAIADQMGLHYITVLEDIQHMRQQLKEWQRDSLENLAAERIASFRNIQHHAWQLLELLPKQSNQLLSVILRAEEAIARIQGVLTDRVQHLVSGRLEHKLYDFVDKLPAPTVEGEVVVEVPRRQTPLDSGGGEAAT